MIVDLYICVCLFVFGFVFSYFFVFFPFFVVGLFVSPVGFGPCIAPRYLHVERTHLLVLLVLVKYSYVCSRGILQATIINNSVAVTIMILFFVHWFVPKLVIPPSSVACEHRRRFTVKNNTS